MSTEVENGPGKKAWIWAIVGLVLVIGLITWAVSTAQRNNTANMPATSGSVQNSATGSQGAVGNFREQVVPNGPNQTGTSGTVSRGGELTSPPGTVSRGPATGTSNAPRSYSAGQEMGAGNTGISTSTDTMGGAPVPSQNGKGQSPGKNTSTNQPNDTSTRSNSGVNQ